MALTAHDILTDADLFRRAYPDWPHPGRDRLAALRASLLADGWTATSPVLDDEAERMAREERQS